MPSTTAFSRRLAAHALDRIAFGPRPGDVECVLRSGVELFIENQIAAGAPDPGLASRLSGCPGVSATAAEIILAHQTQGFSRAPIENALEDLRSAKLIRAIHAENQLAEIMADFWYNHFNVYAYAWEPSVPAYEREAIRPHALGRFRDLLGAVASHPAMLYFLDNYLSTGPRTLNGKTVVGLNENYGRELLELHTVGVDAGYTQRDVLDAARVFTGWGIEGLVHGEPPTFLFCFRADRHDAGAKDVLGLEIPAGGGQEEGDLLLDSLAAHPATARFVSRKLALRFVSDDPPRALVEKAAGVFLSTGGDIRAVLREILLGPEFRAPASIGGKPKSPFEFVVSANRTLGLEMRDGRPTAAVLEEMGMPLYGCKPPTGYSNRGRDWPNPSSQVARFDFAFKLAAGAVPGVEAPAGARIPDPKSAGLMLAGPGFQAR